MTLPRAAERLLDLAAPADLREAVAGDLVEMLGEELLGGKRPGKELGEERGWLVGRHPQLRLWAAVLRSLPGLLAIRWERLHESRRPPALAFWLLGFLAVACILRLHDLARSLVPLRAGTAAQPGWMAAALAAAALAGLLAGAAGAPRSRSAALRGALAWVLFALAAVASSSASYPAPYIAALAIAPPVLAWAGMPRRRRLHL